VRLSHRYIPARQLPDKSVSLLDTAAARVAIGQHAIPAEVDDCRRRIEALKTEQEILGREAAVGLDHSKRAREIAAAMEEENGRLKGMEADWKKEKDLVEKSLAIRAQLRGPSGEEPVEGTGSKVEAAAAAAADENAPQAAQLSEGERAKLLAELKELQKELAEVQGDSPL